MQPGLVEAIVRGDHAIWIGVGALWLVTTSFVLGQRRDPRARYLRLIALLLVTTATSVVGMDLAAALAIPRIEWKPAPDPSLVAANGETWRRLGGPAVDVVLHGAHDVALPTIDSEGRWILYGMLSGAPLAGYPPAAGDPPEPGGARICALDADEHCRAWPATWPNPERPPRETAPYPYGPDDYPPGLRAAAGAIAYDVETESFWRGRATDGHGEIEVLGRIGNEPPHEGNAVLFMMHRLVDGRYDAMRVVSTPNHAGETFRLERARAELLLAPRVFRYVARPLLIAAAASLPIAALAYLFAPALFAAQLKRRAVAREAATGLRLIPAGAPDESGTALATVADDASLGDVALARGTMVRLGASDGRPMASRSWLEIVAPVIATSEPGGPRRVGILVPADAEPFRRAAQAWMYDRAHPLAVFIAGLAVAAPAIVAIAALIGAK